MRLVRYVTQEGVLGVGRIDADGEVVEFLSAVDSIPFGAHPPITGMRLALVQVRLLTPIARPPKVLTIRQTRRPDGDIALAVTNKQTTAVTGPDEPIWLPAGVSAAAFDAALGVVIGSPCRQANDVDVRSVVAGYVAVNDVSLPQMGIESPLTGLTNSYDGHAPIGPWLVTADEVADPHRLSAVARVNGETVLASAGIPLNWSIWDVISMISQHTTLEVGDIVAFPFFGQAGARPFDGDGSLHHGDHVEIEIEGVGVLSNPVLSETAADIGAQAS